MKTKSLFVAAFLAAHFSISYARAQSPGREPLGSDSSSSHLHGSHAECSLPTSTQDIVACASEEHPDVKRAKLSAAESAGQAGVATQLLNPTLDLQTVSGRIGSESKSETQISLLFPIELGGKRLARKAVAVAESTIAEAEVGEVRSNVVIQTILNLHRLRQIESERKILVEAKRAFERIFGQQKARVGLSPEQRVATSLYNLSSAEAVVRLSDLDEEERGLEHYFHLATGNSLSELRKFLPATPTLWPSLPVANNEFLSPGKMKAMAGVKVSNAQTLSSRAAVWPDFFFGPMAQIESENGQRGSIFGLQLTLGLPILSLNNAGRAFAALGQTRATRGSELTFSEEKHEREEQARIYLQAVEVLKAAPSADDLQRLHRDQERFGNQGLLSPALTIESHRKIEELTISRHQRELKALNALWQIRKYDGRIFTEKL